MKTKHKKIIQHTLFWLVYTTFWHFVFAPDPASFGSMLTSLCFTIANMFAGYTLIYFLVPKYLYNKNLPVFLLGLFAVVSMAAVLNAGLIWVIFEAQQPGIAAQFFSTGYGYGAVFGSNFSAALIVLAIHQHFRRKENEKRTQALEKLQLETELKYLKGQLNPHFLFNALNSIYFLIKKNPDQAAEALAGFSDLLRHQLYQSSDEEVPLAQEMEYLEKYTQLAKLRLPDDLKLGFSLPQNMNGQKIAPFLLQPLVENAFKYVSRKNGKIAMEAEIKNNQFNFSIKNNMELNPGKELTKGGIGLENLKRRLNLLYPNKHELISEEKGGEFIVELNLKI